jgi:gas vesicle protein
MVEKNEERPNKMNTAVLNIALYIGIGVLIGGLAGATTMLFTAPQSGKRTRDLVRNRTIKLANQTSKSIQDAVGRVRTETDKLSAGVSGRAQLLKQRSQKRLLKQMDKVSAALDAGKSSLESM